MSFVKKTVRKLTRFAGTIVVAVFVFYGLIFLLLHNDNVNVERYAELSSRDNSYQLLIDVADPSTPYGSHRIDLSVTDASRQTLVSKQLRLANDGKIIGSENVDAYWTSRNHVDICLRGEEQTDVLVSVDVPNRQITVSDMEC